MRKYSKGKYDRHGVEWFCYAILGEINLSPLQVYEGYRRRFGIESSYRLMNEVRARTTSRNPALRLLLVGIAFILLNIWVYLKWILGQPRRGGRYIHRKLFVLSQLRLFLTEAVKQIYGFPLLFVNLYLPLHPNLVLLNIKLTLNANRLFLNSAWVPGTMSVFTLQCLGTPSR